ncbi:hypothetical protein Mapa_015086 [Marchantia paleacea]|nr:hypothetical protein Mapa_015086 [Marchantia paleacea]
MPKRFIAPIPGIPAIPAAAILAMFAILAIPAIFIILIPIPGIPAKLRPGKLMPRLPGTVNCVGKPWLAAAA